MPTQKLRHQLSQLLPSNAFPIDSSPFLLDQRKRYISENCVVVQPDSIEQIQNLVRFCTQHNICITPQGGNTGLVGGSVAYNGVILNMSRMNRIRSVNLADNSMTVDAGCVLQQVQIAAQQHQRFFPLSLASEGTCQIGGNIACNAGGLNVLRYGSMRDLVLGLEIVLPNGELLSHLAPLHKNTTSYELKHLFIGSEGTLGIITGATLKLFAPQQSLATAWIGVSDIKSAVHLLSQIKNQFDERLCSFELISDFALQLSAQFSQISPPVQAPWHILIELSDSLIIQDLVDLLSEFLYKNQWNNTVLAQSEQEQKQLWALRENISASQRILGANIKHDIAMPISHIADFIASCATDLSKHYPEIKLVVFGHLGDGSLHYNTFLPHILNNEIYQYEDHINRIVYQQVLAHEGTIAAEHGIGSLKKHWLTHVRSATEIMLMKTIKAQLDPQNLFNPNKLLPN